MGSRAPAKTPTHPIPPAHTTPAPAPAPSAVAAAAAAAAATATAPPLPHPSGSNWSAPAPVLSPQPGSGSTPHMQSHTQANARQQARAHAARLAPSTTAAAGHGGTSHTPVIAPAATVSGGGGGGPLAAFPTYQPTVGTTTTPDCPHYARNCHLRAPCCGALVACRRCHDALVPDGHTMDRRAVTMLKCLACNSQDQPVAPFCAFCGVSFASYFCPKCVLFDDTPGRSAFHCHGCGVCRAGRREDYRHCDTCKACYPVVAFDAHRCSPNVLAALCAVCKKDMQETVRAVTVMACGHAMHQGCFEYHVKSSFACKECGKSVGDMRVYWNVLDRALAKELAHVTELVNILCRDCGASSTARKHNVYHKCGQETCGSYNTVRR